MFKIFGSKKEEFFLEIDDSQDAPKAEASKAQTPVEKPVETPVAASAEAQEAQAPAAPKAEKPAKTTKKGKAKSQEAPAPKAAAPAAPPAPAIPAKPEAPEPVMLFAPDNLMPLPNPTRRRPGPNMAAFLDMAKQVKRR
ncbi:MAG: hypothetical protein WBB29_01555 [Geitlerinemataceae cyanobacterium]